MGVGVCRCGCAHRGPVNTPASVVWLMLLLLVDGWSGQWSSVLLVASTGVGVVVLCANI